MRLHRIFLFSLACCYGTAEAQTPLSTPNEALAHFFEATHKGDFQHAATFLLPPGNTPLAAKRLMFLLEQHLEAPAPPEALQETTQKVVKLGHMSLGLAQVPVEFVLNTDTPPQWRFSARIVRQIDALFSQHGNPMYDYLPRVLVTQRFLTLEYWQWLGLFVILLFSAIASAFLVAALKPALLRITRLTKTNLDDVLVVQLSSPVRLEVIILCFVFGSRWLALPKAAQSTADDLATAFGIAIIIWALLRLSHVISDSLVMRAGQDGDELSKRGIITQVKVLRRVVDAIILVVGGALVLLQFQPVREIGMSILASAGVGGLVIGLAAQRSISNMLAGIQISLTQPIRIGDTVIVEGEWGTIEEITLTYVVVKVWDLRRLVVPITMFIEKSFQNWTRTSSSIMGTVMVHADYVVDVDAARRELLRLLEPTRGNLWNGEVQNIQITDLSERTMTLRALVSSDDASKNWDLRCLVREGLVRWLARQTPNALPRLRAEGLKWPP